MLPKKATSLTLAKVWKNLKKGSEDAIGSYLYKGFRVQVSRYKQSTAERVKALYYRRRKAGLCIQCGKKVSKKNALTGKLYRLCDHHRKLIDHK